MIRYEPQLCSGDSVERRTLKLAPQGLSTEEMAALCRGAATRSLLELPFMESLLSIFRMHWDPEPTDICSSSSSSIFSIEREDEEENENDSFRFMERDTKTA